MADPAAVTALSIDELREQLQEAREVLAAIRRGEVDALLVGESGLEQVYTLTSAERPYRVMVEQMKQGAATLSPEGQVLYANRRLATMLGVRLEQLIGADLAGWLEGGRDVLVRLLSAGGCELETRLCPRDGQPMPVQVSMAELVDAGSRRFCAVISDLTQQRTHERLRESEEQLRRMDRRKNEFLAMLGHELRNPLAPISHATEILKHSVAPMSSRARWALEVIGRQVRHLTRMVDDLLDIGRIARGAVELQRRPVCLQEVLEGAVELVRPLYEDRGHELVRDVPDQRLWCDGDAARMVQVVGNLLRNAGKYTPPGGRVLLSLGRDDGEAWVAVTDNGVGMPAELVPRVFESFTQGEAPHVRADRGLGLGLAVARQIVEGHGGTIAAYSEGPGRGSRFELRLPVIAAPESREGADAGERSAADRSRRVLVVDDNRDAAEALALLLEHRGFEARIAFEGDGALSVAEEFQPEVALLDIGLPGIDGYELAGRLRTRLGEGVTLVAVTGYGQHDDRRRSLEVGFDHHCIKPVQIAEIEELVRGSAPAD